MSKNLTPQVKTLYEYGGLENLEIHFNIKDIKIVEGPEIYGNEKDGYAYWVSYSSKRAGLLYDFYLDFSARRIHISTLEWKTKNELFFPALLCGLINNAGDNFDIITFNATEKNRLDFLCAKYGCTPDLNSSANILVNNVINNYSSEGINDFFHTDIGLEYIYKNGQRYIAEFKLDTEFAHLKHLIEELKYNQILNWLAPEWLIH